jgi:type II restriction/modification system DNA methylase subunit YeeA
LLKGKPLLAEDATEVETEWQTRFDSLKTNEEELNRIFAGIYGLEGEVPIEVPDDKVSVRRFDRSRETRSLVSYAIGCMFGRYSLDVDGLVLADQGSTLEDYLAKVPSPTFMPDEDGILPVTEGEWFEDDAASRFSAWLKAAFGEEHFRENLLWVEESLGASVRAYLAKPGAGGFYDDHCKTYSVTGSGKRPIYWMFSSPKNSFNALVYMHRYDEGTVSRLLTGYVRELRRKLEAQAEVLSRSSTARDQSTAARYKDMIVELVAWEQGCLYKLAQEHVSIDLDDGVKVNYAKFVGAVRKI